MQLSRDLLRSLLTATRGQQPLERRAWEAFVEQRRRAHAPPYVAVVAMPKSGSTFLSNYLSRCLGLPYRRLCYAYASNEHELYPPAFIANSESGAVSQLHMRGTPHNVEILASLEVSSVILSRNVFDALVSFRNDLRAKQALGHVGEGLYGYSFVWLTEKLLSASDDELLEYSIDFYLPWYCNFLLSWERMQQSSACLFLRYERLMLDREATLRRVFDFLDAPEKLQPRLMDADFIGKTRGISSTRSPVGSGRDLFSTEQRSRIERALSRFDSDLLRDHLAPGI